MDQRVRKGVKMSEKFLKQQQEKLTNGSIGRRQFVMSAVAMGMTVPFALSLAEQV